MKTQEEIRKMAEKFAYAVDGSKEGEQSSAFGYEMGYTKCQEDMAKDIEYWQGESDHWYKQAMDMADKYNALLNKQD